VVGGVVGGKPGIIAGGMIGRNIARRFFVTAESAGCEEVQSECVEVEPTMEEHNQALVEAIRGGAHLTISDYIEGGVLTSDFDVAQTPAGNWRVNAHNGVDGVGGFAKTPFYTRLYEIVPYRASNPITLEIIGTDLRMQIIHADSDPVGALTVGTIFSPGQEILPFPRYSNGAGTAAHFHFQIAEHRSHFVHPLTLNRSARDTIFRFSTNGGDSWLNFNLRF